MIVLICWLVYVVAAAGGEGPPYGRDPLKHGPM